MKVLLMHPDRDFDAELPLPGESETIAKDLELATLWQAMAAGDEFLLDVARKAMLLCADNDAATVVHRQQVLGDAIANPAVLRELYALAVEAIEGRRDFWLGSCMSSPSAILSGAVGLMKYYAGMLHKLRGVAERHADRFESPGMNALFAMLRAEFDDDYIASIEQHLKWLRFGSGVRISASLGDGNEGIGHVLRQAGDKPHLWQRWLHTGPAQFSFRLHERDEAGARFLSDLEGRGTNLVANALAQSCEHVQSFFQALHTELAFYVAALNLHAKLSGAGVAIAMPGMAEPGTRRLTCTDLRDACLVLALGPSVVGNSVAADGRGLLVVTGANQGGKSSFLRACGVAQLMLQTGLFVCARAYAGERCTGLFTHYKREEDASLASGKLDEELARMSAIADLIRPGALFLSNESFASTYEREGSEIARQVIGALRERGIKVIAVTHLFDFADRLAREHRRDTLFLRAERHADGSRSFRLIEVEPLSTSFGADLYQQVFGGGAGESGDRQRRSA